MKTSMQYTASATMSDIPIAASVSAGESTGHAVQNWAFLAFIALIPLQSLYTAYFPARGPVNFLNLMFVASLLLAWRCKGRLVRSSGVNAWVWAYLGMSVIALWVAAGHLQDSSGHLNILKDQTIAVAFLFLAQWSASDEFTLRRLLLASLLPLPYMLLVVLDQHAAVSSWHYSHDLRIAGTFSHLGANELAAFFTTSTLLGLGLLVGTRASTAWRLVLISAVGCAAVGVALTYSRTAYIAILLGVVLILILRRGGMRLFLPVALALVLLPALLPTSVMQRFDSITVEEGKRDESTDNRFRFWQVAREEFSKRPLLGTGFHSFQHAEVNPYRTDTHNFFLRELTEKGLVGAVVLLGLLIAIARLLWFGLRRSAPGSWSYGLALGLCGAFVALLCANSFGDRFTHYPMIAHFWLYIGLLLRSLMLDAVAIKEAKHVHS